MGQLALCGAVVSSDALAVTSQNFEPSKAREKKTVINTRRSRNACNLCILLFPLVVKGMGCNAD